MDKLRHCPLGTAREPLQKRCGMKGMEWTSALVHCPKSGLFGRRDVYASLSGKLVSCVFRGLLGCCLADVGGAAAPDPFG